MEKDRADKMMVSLGLAETRSKAAQMIERKEVYFYGEPVRKASQSVTSDGLEVRAEDSYVGRGAYKLIEAIQRFSVNFKDKKVADVGASTGGFTEVALKNGAKKVFAIDVGHDQLAQVLRDDERVINLEGTNIREMKPLEELVDIAVVDLSFISLEMVHKEIEDLVKVDGEIIYLIKPQFELDKKSLGKKGIVKDPLKQLEALEKTFKFLYPQKVCSSPIKGKEGNKEFLFYCIKGREKTDLEIMSLKSLVEECNE